MTEIEKASSKSTSEIFSDFLKQLRQQNPMIAIRLEKELLYLFGKPAIDQRVPLEVIIAWQIERRVSSKSVGELCTPESYVANLFSPDSDNQEVDVRKFLRELVAD
jgi:hypothetical protein